MLYLYDNAIVDDLIRSFNPDNIDNPVVKVISPEQIVGIAAQIQNDEIAFPIVAVSRPDAINIDNDSLNFTKMHKGIQSVIDSKTNELYYEKSIPIKITYDLTILTTNTVDRDELVRELLFKYTSMYFLTIKLPYECSRKIRFGVTLAPDSEIEYTSSSADYIEKGQLYQSIIHLKCDGCVLVSYTSAKLKRMSHKVLADEK